MKSNCIILEQRFFGTSGNFFQGVSEAVKNVHSVLSSTQKKVFFGNNPCIVISLPKERCKRILLNPKLFSPEEFKKQYDEDLPQNLVSNYNQVFFNYDTKNWEGFDEQTDIALSEQTLLSMLTSPRIISVKETEKGYYIAPVQQFLLADVLSGKEEKLPLDFSFENACRKLALILEEKKYPTYQAIKVNQLSLMMTTDGTLYTTEDHDPKERLEHSTVFFPDLCSSSMRPFNSVSVYWDSVVKFWLEP